MVKTEKHKIPDLVFEAYNLLQQHRIVDITKPLDWNHNENESGWVFECVAKVPYPNLEDIPHEVPLFVLIPEAFPLEPVDFYPKCEEVSGFPHQDAESRKLCLPEERLAPRNAQRLVCYVNWAIEWLKDAANGTLLKPGDPYELPDFSRKLLKKQLSADYILIFNESAQSYEKWKPNIGKVGNVECILGQNTQTIFAVRFFNDSNSIVHEAEFSATVLKQDNKVVGEWFILPDIRYKRHRPPQTYREIEKLCSTNGLDFYNILKKAWDNDERNLQIGLILVGFPIPRTVGEEPVEIHWQPLIFPNLRFERKSGRYKGKAGKPFQIWSRLTQKGGFSRSEQLPWGKVANVAWERMYARGAYTPEVQATHIAIFGCGALGSSIAELLARGGVRKLSLFDFDNINFGNLCRHTLGGLHVGSNKALSLAIKLSWTNPLSKIDGYLAKIPLNSSSLQETREAIEKAELFINCTTNEMAFDWLEDYAKKQYKRLVLIFFNFHAEILTLCVSGIATSCGEVFQDLLSCVRNEQLSIDAKTYLYQPSKEEQIIEGAGCWHPTFPALNAHIQMLAASAVDILCSHIEQGEEKGLAAIIKRNSITGKEIQPSSLVEVVWIKQYP